MTWAWERVTWKERRREKKKEGESKGERGNEAGRGGDGHWGKKEKNKNYSWYSAQGPGRMAQTPQAGTGDSVSRFRRSRCSALFNYKSYFLVGWQFCFQLVSRPRFYDYCQIFKMSASFYSMQVSFRFHSLRSLRYLYLRVSAQRFEPGGFMEPTKIEPGGFIEPRRFRIIFP